MFSSPLEATLLMLLGVIAPFILAIVLGRTRQKIALLILIVVVGVTAAWLYSQSQGMGQELLDRGSALFLFLFTAAPAFIATLIGAFIGWLLHRRTKAD